MAREIRLEDIKAVTPINLSRVYDISVAGNHNYYLDYVNHMLVHNSGKTWSGIDKIIHLCTEVEQSCTINIYRQTYAEFKETLYEDFKRRLDDFDLNNPFKRLQEVKSFKIGQNKITFIGCDRLGSKHGAGCDYAFFNEMMHIPNDVFDQVEMRCRKFWWGDYNPSVTQHWVFDKVLKRTDVAFIRTTFLDNPYVSKAEKRKILSFEPWEPESYYIENDTIMYNGAVVDDLNQPPPHLDNIEDGTADVFMWKVYGLGLRGAMKGVIYKNVAYISEFPKHLAYTYGLDFGFTTDPTALVKYGKEGRNVYMELLFYAPTETSEELHQALKALGISEYVPITADSADRYVSERKGVVQMVRELFDRGWEISKVSKTKGITYWILDMKGNKIHIVINDHVHFFKVEQENYRWKEVNGIQINQPIDGHDHAFSSGRYAHMSHDINNLSADWD